MRTLVNTEATLTPYFKTAGILRWFDRQLPPQYAQQGTCARVLRVSTVRTHTMQGITALAQPLFQVDVLDVDPERARAAAAAVIAWLQKINLASATNGNQFPNFVTNQRAGMDYDISDKPLYVETVTFRSYALEN